MCLIRMRWREPHKLIHVSSLTLRKTSAAARCTSTERFAGTHRFTEDSSGNVKVAGSLESPILAALCSLVPPGPGFVRVDRTQHLFVLVPAPLGVLEVLRARLDRPARPCESVFGSRTLADHGVHRSVLLIHQGRDVGQVGWQWWAFSPFPYDLSFHKLLKPYARVYHRTDHPLADTHHLPFLTDAYHGDVRRRHEVSARLSRDVRQGAHARAALV